MSPPKGPKPAVKNRSQNPFKQSPPVRDWDKLHDVLNLYGAAWEKWGLDVLSELDALEEGNRGNDDPGNPPTDATKPPKPPFNP